MWQRFGRPPLIVIIYLILAVACSAVWLYSFKLQILEPPNDVVVNRGSSEERKTLLTLLLAYVIHLPVLVSLPFCSRPWLWSKKPDSLRLAWSMLGWDEGGDHWCNCLLGGLRAAASFLLAWAPFCYATRASRTSMAGILGLALEGFFAAEMVKHTEGEDGFFMCQMASAACAAQRVFGRGGSEWWTVFCVCIALILLHSLLPFYEDVFTLLPDPYVPEDAAVGVLIKRGAAPPSAQAELQSAANSVADPPPDGMQASGPLNNV